MSRKPRVARIVLTADDVQALVETAQCYEGEGVAHIAAMAQAALPAEPVRVPTCAEVRAENAALKRHVERIEAKYRTESSASFDALDTEKRTRFIGPTTAWNGTIPDEHLGWPYLRQRNDKIEIAQSPDGPWTLLFRLNIVTR